MAHPKNKRERLEVGNRKGKKRIEGWNLPEQFVEEQVHLHRDTTKCCGGMCCKNERKVYGTKTIQERKADIEDRIDGATG